MIFSPPIRSGVSVARQWQTVNEHREGLRRDGTEMWGRQHFPAASANGRMRRMFRNDGMFPFRIYQLPGWYRSAPNPAADWLKVCVRAGLVNNTLVTTGTDGEAWGYDETFPVSAGAGVNEITLSANTTTYLWLDSTPSVQSGASWPGSFMAALGYVDTTQAVVLGARIRQIQFGDVLVPYCS